MMAWLEVALSMKHLTIRLVFGLLRVYISGIELAQQALNYIPQCWKKDEEENLFIWEKYIIQKCTIKWQSIVLDTLSA